MPHLHLLLPSRVRLAHLRQRPLAECILHSFKKGVHERLCSGLPLRGLVAQQLRYGKHKYMCQRDTPSKLCQLIIGLKTTVMSSCQLITDLMTPVDGS